MGLGWHQNQMTNFVKSPRGFQKYSIHWGYSVAKNTDLLAKDTWRMLKKFLIILIVIKLFINTQNVFRFPARFQNSSILGVLSG